MKHLPEIPDIPDSLKQSIRLLAGVATIYHGVLVQMAEGKTWKEVESENGDLLRVGEELIRAWGEKLGFDKECGA